MSMDAEVSGSGMSKSEKRAWIGLVVFAVGALYMAWNLFFRHPASQTPDTDPGEFFILLWLIYWLTTRKDASLPSDERDRKIAARANSVGYCVLALTMFASAKFLVDWWGEAQATTFMRSVSLYWLDGYLMLLLVTSLATGSATSVYLYWRGRQ